MTRALLLAAATALSATAASAQTTSPGTVTLFELPGYLGRSVAVSADTPDLSAQLRARSARVSGSWQFCPQASYAGTCRTVTANQPLLNPVPVSIRSTASTTGATAATPATSATTTAAIDLSALDAAGGTDGQDVTFFARPTLSGSEVSAGTNDLAAATAFCKLAGATSATAAGRARVQASNLIDVTAATRVRGAALRDVVCRR